MTLPADVPIREPARAKLNLTLRIAGRRGDGLHEVQSLIAFADARPGAPAVADTVTFFPGAPPDVTVSGRFSDGIVGDNLVSTALERLAHAEPRLTLGAVAIEKNIPVAAGLGGGSANAAALMRAVRRANPDFASTVDWFAIAASLGADVPVCLAGRPSWVTGFGERLEPVCDLPPLGLVLINPQAAVPADKTAQVFRRLAARPLPEHYAAASAPILETDGALLGFMAAHGNDLTVAAIAAVPQIADVLAALKSHPACRHSALSGAGPTCFGVFGTPAIAAADLAAAHPQWWVRAASLEQVRP